MTIHNLVDVRCDSGSRDFLFANGDIANISWNLTLGVSHILVVQCVGLARVVNLLSSFPTKPCVAVCAPHVVTTGDLGYEARTLGTWLAVFLEKFHGFDLARIAFVAFVKRFVTILA